MPLLSASQPGPRTLQCSGTSCAAEPLSLRSATPTVVAIIRESPVSLENASAIFLGQRPLRIAVVLFYSVFFWRNG